MSLPAFDWATDMAQWTLPRYAREEVNAAGDVLVSPYLQMGVHHETALSVMDNWRTSHTYPLRAFRNTLENRAAEVDHSYAVVSQRLKRLRSITAKLQRMKRLKLGEIQDIGGCRAVLRSTRRVRLLVGLYKARDAKTHHTLWREDDYITNPKKTGYRSHHLIYEYGTAAKELECFAGQSKQ